MDLNIESVFNKRVFFPMSQIIGYADFIFVIRKDIMDYFGNSTTVFSRKNISENYSSELIEHSERFHVPEIPFEIDNGTCGFKKKYFSFQWKVEREAIQEE